MTVYREMATHRQPHLDELVAIWLLRRYGKNKELFGLDTAKITFHDAGATHPEGLTPKDLEAQGILPVGIWGSIFDEHPNRTEGRKGNECAATLVAKHLDVHERPELKKLLAFTRFADLGEEAKTEGVEPRHAYDLASLVNIMNRSYPSQPEQVLNWAFAAISGIVTEQRKFFAAKADLEKAIKFEVEGQRGKVHRIVIVETDNPRMTALARSKEGGVEANIVVVRQSSGHTQILTDLPATSRAWRDLTRLIRIRELNVRGIATGESWETLESEGANVQRCEMWHVHAQGRNLLNGSLTARNVEPSKLTLAQIREAIELALNPRAFEPNRQEKCLQNTCSHMPGNPCPFHNLGLLRCREIRHKSRPVANRQPAQATA